MARTSRARIRTLSRWLPRCCRGARYAGALLTGMALAAVPAQAGTLLVANKSAASVTLVDDVSFAALATLAVGDGPHEIAVSPDGRRALVSNYGTGERPGASLSVIDVPAASVVRTVALPAGARPHGIEWLDDRRAAVTAEGLQSVLLVDVDAGAVLEQIVTSQAGTHMLALAADGERAFTANIGAGTVSVLTLGGTAPPQHLPAGAGTEGIAVVGSGELWVSNRESGTLRIFDLATLAGSAPLPLAGFPIRVEPDDSRGRVYVTLAVGDALAVFDARRRERVARIDFSGNEALAPSSGSMLGRLGNGSIPVGVLLSGDGARLFVAHTQADAVSVIDADSLEVLRVVPGFREPDGMAWSARSALSPDTSR